MTIFGVDVSHYQGAVNWAKAEAAGVAFGIAKATQGTSFTDDRYAQNVAGARAAGVVPGAYHFLTGADPVRQAEFFDRVVGDPEGILVALDVEGAGCTAGIVRAWVDRYRALRPGHPILIYTGKWFWRDLTDNMNGPGLGPLWAAGSDAGRYVGGSGILQALWAKTDGTPTSGLPWGGWTSWVFDQFTDKAIVPGISGPCDGDAFSGTMTDLRALTTSSTPTTGDEYMPLTPEDLKAIQKAVWADADLNVLGGGKTADPQNRAALAVLTGRNAAVRAADDVAPVVLTVEQIGAITSAVAAAVSADLAGIVRTQVAAVLKGGVDAVSS
jgi:GH25 family lysozyme M1 (1,4-beta-N-acetylmuramidase)